MLANIGFSFVNNYYTYAINIIEIFFILIIGLTAIRRSFLFVTISAMSSVNYVHYKGQLHCTIFREVEESKYIIEDGTDELGESLGGGRRGDEGGRRSRRGWHALVYS